MIFTEQDRTPDERASTKAWGERLERLGHLYHYDSVRDERRFEWFVDLVARSELFFRPYRKLNDPFDGAVQLTYEATDEEIRDLWVRHLKESGKPLDAEARATIDRFVAGARDPDVHKILREVQDRETAQLGVYCFCETADDPRDLPMWSYYADAHRGVCLRFRAEHLGGWENCVAPVPVTYEDAYPAVSFYRDSRFKRSQVITSTKAKVWSHEREWRMVRGEHGSMTFDPVALDGVILGCRMSAEDEARVRRVLAEREPRLELLRAREEEREFKLAIRPAD